MRDWLDAAERLEDREELAERAQGRPGESAGDYDIDRECLKAGDECLHGPNPDVPRLNIAVYG